MLTKKQLSILEAFYHDLEKELTFKEIKEQSKQKSNNMVQIALNQFKKHNIITTRKTADVCTYTINLENNTASALLNLINEDIILKAKIPHDTLKTIQDKIRSKTPFFMLIVFGSFAKGKATAKSDLDIAIIVENDTIRKEITPLLETIKRREAIDIDYHIITAAEYKEMLKMETENLAKQIHKDKLIIYGYTHYMNMVRFYGR